MDRPAVLAVWAQGYAAGARRVIWTPSADARLPLVLGRGGRLRLRLTEAAGSPVSGVAIDLEDGRRTGARILDLWHRAMLGGGVGSSDDLRRASETLLFEDPKEPGVYRIGPIEPGPYELVAERPGYKPLRVRLSIPDDDPEGVAGGVAAPFSTARIGALDLRFDMEPEPPGGGGR